MSETRVHTIFGILFVLSFFGTEQIAKLLPTWNDPKVGLLSFVIGVLWLTMFFLGRAKPIVDEMKVVRDRLERIENRLQRLEDEQRDQATPKL